MSTMTDLNWEEIEQSDAMKTFMSHAPLYPEGFIKSKPGGVIMPRSYPDFHLKMKEFVPRDNDVWVSSYPKTGTTWTQEMVWNIVHDVNLEVAKSATLDERYTFIEAGGLMTPHVEGIYKEKYSEMPDMEMFMDIWMKSIETAEAQPKYKPRMIKTHLPVEFLPKEVIDEAKIIYVARNPRDVVSSWHNHWCLFEEYSGDLSSFLDAFIDDSGPTYNPFFYNVLGYWNIRDQSNLLFITYEEMKKDLKAVIRKVCEFLGKTLTETQMDTLLAHLQFDAMKKNAAVNQQQHVDHLAGEGGNFMNKGVSGGWKKKLTEDQINRMEAWENKHLENSDLKFVYE